MCYGTKNGCFFQFELSLCLSSQLFRWMLTIFCVFFENSDNFLHTCRSETLEGFSSWDLSWRVIRGVAGSAEQRDLEYASPVSVWDLSIVSMEILYIRFSRQILLNILFRVTEECVSTKHCMYVSKYFSIIFVVISYQNSKVILSFESITFDVWLISLSNNASSLTRFLIVGIACIRNWG